MATNGEISGGETEMAECDGEVVTMMDVLKEQQDFEDDANAVLGGSDEKECTYSQGYIKRQAIYACVTCCPESKDDPSKRAGFCLACSLTCHESHDLVELYTKRDFRCDCGNPKFKSPCQFTPNKPDLNDKNVYNQNFVGLYCICSKPYGDQESTLDDEMIQCIICEDWWHASHLDSVIPANDQYSEMICKLCMTNNEFLQDYSNLAVNVETGDVDVVKVSAVNDSTVTDEKLTNGSVTKEKLVNGTATDEKLTNAIDEDAACNDMETSTTDVPNEATPSSDNDDEARSTEKECIEPEKSENEAVDKPVEAEENSIKSTDAPMETDETDKAAEVILEDKSEDKHETKNSEASANKVEDSSASAGKTEESRAVSEEKVDETSANCEENCTPTEEKRSEGNTEKSSAYKPEDETTEKPTENTDLPTTDDGVETPPTESFKTDESFNQANSESNNAEEAEKSSENMETSESKITEKTDSDTDAEDEEIGKESATTESPTADTEIPSAKTNDLPSGETNNLTSADTEIPSAETNDLPSTGAEIPSAETNDTCSENTTDETEAAKPSQDEEMNDISKATENENVSDNIPAAKDNTCKADESENGDSKDDSTNKESDSNESIVPEPASIENKRKVSTEDVIDEISAKKPKLDDSKCVRPKGIRKVYKGATFWPATFRQKLCTCNECISMYKDLSVLFLTDLEDTVFAYETLGKERTAGKPNQYEKGLEALCSLGRIQQIDALTEYNKMRDKLLTFLQSFKDRKEIVTEHDIKTFFAGMKPEKRIDGVYFCG